MPSNARIAQGRHAAAVRWGHPNKSEIERDYLAAKVEAYVSRVLADAPPLTNEQRERIAALLAPGVVRVSE